MGTPAITNTVRIAFKKNDVHSSIENLICLFSMDRHVHAEVHAMGYAFSAHERSTYPIDVFPVCDCRGEWDFVDVPFASHTAALSILYDMTHRCAAKYGYNPLHMTLPKPCLDVVEHDLDCMRPETWQRLYCSQFVLLFLRRCAIQGLLPYWCKANLLWSVNSHGCPPARLMALIERVFHRWQARPGSV